jgi:hypothetical protein
MMRRRERGMSIKRRSDEVMPWMGRQMRCTDNLMYSRPGLVRIGAGVSDDGFLETSGKSSITASS